MKMLCEAVWDREVLICGKKPSVDIFSLVLQLKVFQLRKLGAKRL